MNRTRRARMLWSAIGACVVAAGFTVSGCSVDGDPVAGMPDLASRSVAATDFPDGRASPIPAPAVADVLADVTGAPRGGQQISPRSCAPATVEAGGASALLGAGSAERSTYTTAVVYVDTPLADVAEQLARCPRWTSTTAGASSTVTAATKPAPTAPDGVTTLASTRIIETGGGGEPMTTSTLTLIGQRGDVRVYVEYRWPTGDPITSDAATGLDALFTKAVAAAFG